MFFSHKTNFPEFMVIDNQEPLILDDTSKDDGRLDERGQELVERTSMDVREYKIKKADEGYGLYIR